MQNTISGLARAARENIAASEPELRTWANGQKPNIAMAVDILLEERDLLAQKIKMIAHDRDDMSKKLDSARHMAKTMEQYQRDRGTPSHAMRMISDELEIFP